jgi:hypothetical protein
MLGETCAGVLLPLPHTSFLRRFRLPDAADAQNLSMFRKAVALEAFPPLKIRVYIQPGRSGLDDFREGIMPYDMTRSRHVSPFADF